jgi:sarcosine oxidase subunit delta
MSLKITCPICGERDGYEFVFGAEERGPRPEEESLTPQKWCNYVHMRDNIGGTQTEWWFHRKGCGLWFTIQRNTLQNKEIKPSMGKE